MRRTLPVIIATVLAFVAPQAAAAKPRTVVHPAHYELELVAAGTNDYSVGFFGHSHGTATVLVDTAADSVTYELPAVVTHNRMEIHLGEVIDLAVAFHVTRRRPEGGPQPRHCTGRRGIIAEGEFVGTIEFHGELGYTEVVEASHKGTSEQFFRQVCHPGSRAPASASSIGPPAKQLVAFRTEAGAKTAFRALTGIASPKTYPQWIFEAARAERVGEAKIRRQVIVEAEAGGALGEGGAEPATAAFSPPAPFSGSAEYREGGGAGAWTGSLAVDLPGLAALPLTGEGFAARRCVGLGKGARPCEGSPLAPAYP
ncbi:MAG TPA: hypothetical protein VH268_00260 [Solirubrobacterales bacterium]|nr:hypothetical protein [Solirubrobacterales bacterium]